MTKEYKQKLKNLSSKINKAKSDYEGKQKKLEEERRRKVEEVKNKKEQVKQNGRLTRVEANPDFIRIGEKKKTG